MKILVMLGVCIALAIPDIARADQEMVPDEVLEEGDELRIRHTYCRSEWMMRSFLALVPITGTEHAFKNMWREWGWNSCNPNSSLPYDGKSLQGVYIGYFPEPIFFENEYRKEWQWVVEVELDGKSIFTYVSKDDLEQHAALARKVPVAIAP